MSLSTTVKKVVSDQAYATVGATDLAVETVRSASTKFGEDLKELHPSKVQARFAAVPAEAQQGYADLTDRGQKLVTRIRNQRSTKDLVSQAEATLALGKGAVTTVRNAVADVEKSAKATLTIGRKEAAKAAETVADSVTVDTDQAAKAVETAAKRTKTAAKRTSTTASNRAKSTKAATKRTTTSARKTAASGRKASTKAAAKVGD